MMPDEAAQPVVCRFETILRWAVVVLLVLTGAAAVLLWPLTLLPASIMVVLYILLMVCSLGARRAKRRAGAPEATGDEPPLQPSAAETATEERRTQTASASRAGLHIGVAIAISLIVIALLMASVLLDWWLIAIGSLLIFAYLALLGLPYWAAAIEDEADLEQRRTDESR